MFFSKTVIKIPAKINKDAMANLFVIVSAINIKPPKAAITGLIIAREN